MLFWIIAALIALAVTAALAAPLLLRRSGVRGACDLEIYRDQLSEIDRDLARGVIPPEEAERARTEVARRLLAADRAGAAPVSEAPAGANRALVAVVAVVLIGGGAALYLRQGAPGYPDLPLADRLAAGDAARATRMSQAEAEAQVAAAGTQTLPEIDPDYAAMLEQLRRVVADRPDDLRGWELLSLHEARTGHYAAAARAQERVIALKGAEATPADLAALADRMVAAADGFVSPETEAVLRAILAADPTHPAGLYYTGLLYAQTDRPDIAFRLWRPLAEDGGSTPYGRLAAGLIGDAAFRAGIDYTPPAPRGPTAEDMAAAAEMDPAAREEMIRGMVGRLADRLATQGGPAADWARLISAYGVLGETEAARAVWTEAQTVFAGDTAALEALRAAAAGAGVAE